MLNLVKNILDVYRQDNAEISLHKERTDLLELVDEAFDEISFSVSQKSLKVQIGRDLKCKSHVDKELIRRVIVNILSNAVKYSPNNGIIKIKISNNFKNEAKISIHNQGAGIPKDSQELIFEKYGQAKQSNRNEAHSTGLGLAFCKLAVEAHGGDIGLISETETGVEFWFTLPDSKCQQSNIVASSDNDLEKFALSPGDKKYLQTFSEQIKKFQIFEITSIKKVLKQIELRSKAIEYWHTELEKAVYAGDLELLNKLLTLEK